MASEQIIYVVDDDATVRRAVALLLRTQGYIVDTYVSGTAFLAKAASLRPGCVLLDIQMPELDGLAVLERLKETIFQSPIIVMTGHGDIGTAVTAMRNGAHNFIEKPFDRDAFMSALSEAFALSKEKDGHRLTAAAAIARLDCLSGRERDVLDGLVSGQTNKIMAINLGISPRTVEIHRAHMMERLGVRTLPDALRIALVAELGNRL
jgi:two-component system response regulator FixJ